MATPTTAEVLDAIEATLTGLYPTRKVYRRKRPPGPTRTNLPGLGPGDLDAAGCFVLYTGDADDNSTIGSFEHVHFVTPVDVCYVKLAGPDEADEDPEVRTTRIAVNDALNVPKPSGFPAGVLVLSFEQGTPYGGELGEKRVTVSTQTVRVHATRPRGAGT